MKASIKHATDDYIECTVSWGGNNATLFFASEGKLAVDRVGDTLLCALLLPAMAVGTDLDIDAPVSSNLLGNTAQLQSIFRTWWQDFTHISVTAPLASQRAVADDAPITFFTAGVDSFYSAISCQPQPAALLFVEGFDVQVGQQPLVQNIKERLEHCAAAINTPLRHVRTNYRDFLDMDPRFPSWSRCHGGALASVAHLLGHSTVIVPANFTYNDLFPWGTHPLTDPLWGSSDIRILHHGADTDRVSKCRRLGDSEAAMRHLRVCWKNPDNTYNCGQCEKCIRTMINLYAAGVLNRCESLPQTITPTDIEKLKIHGIADTLFAKQNLAMLSAENKNDQRIARALRKAIRRGQIATQMNNLKIRAQWYTRKAGVKLS